MNTNLALVLLLLAAAIVMFMANRPRMDAVALLMIVIMPFTGVITINEALAGFSDPSIVLIAGLFVIGEGLVRTGVARRLGDWLNATAGSSETRMLVLLMLAVSGLGAFMSSTAVVAIFIPVVLRICQNTGAAPSQLMMPLSFAALISGMLTLVATAPNLVVNAELIRQGEVGFGFFSFTPFGLAFLALGIAYMLFARRFLPVSAKRVDGECRQPNLLDWVTQYDLTDRALRVRVLPDSPLVGKRLEGLPLRDSGVNLLAIERHGHFGSEAIRPNARTELAAGQILLLDVIALPTETDRMLRDYMLEKLPLGDCGYFTDRSQEIGMVEVIVPAESKLIGSSVLQARVRSEMGLTVLGLRHGRKVVSQGLLDETLKVGDTLLLTGFWSDINKLRSEFSDLVVLNLPTEHKEVLPAANLAPQALAVLALTVGMMVSGVVPNVHAVLIGCLLMGLLRCVDFNSAYASINWKKYGSHCRHAALFAGAATNRRRRSRSLRRDAFCGRGSTAGPVGAAFRDHGRPWSVHLEYGDRGAHGTRRTRSGEGYRRFPYPFAMTIAIAASAAFMTPVSSPVNTLVVGPGNYGFGDFLKIGVPFAVVVMFAALALVPWLLRF